MFCSNCGGKIEEGVKFCAKCGTPVNTSSVPNTPPTAGSFGGVTLDQMRENTAQGLADQANAEMHERSNKKAEPPKKKSKLLLIAIIVAPVLLAITSLLLLIRYNSNSFIDNYIEETKKAGIKYTEEDARDNLKKLLKEEMVKETMQFTGICLLILAIPTLFTVIGQKMNKRKMILAAGIVYIFTVFGIPSAVLCFIANAKMKKQE